MWHWSVLYCTHQLLVTCIQVLASKLTTNTKFQNLQDLNSKTFTRIFKYFQAPYLFSSTFKYLEVFIPNSSIFKDFSSTLWTLTYTYTSNVRTSQAQKSGSDTRIWLLVKLCIWRLITAADLNLSIEASKNLLCRVNRYSSLEPNRNSWMHTQPYSHTHTHTDTHSWHWTWLTIRRFQLSANCRQLAVPQHRCKRSSSWISTASEQHKDSCKKKK